ncbi:anti-sigma factor family protein [Amphiplicatus metriothermophilus]|uniref:Transmembrane transcriptional regulator (Anti-sigma factor RsiW) n=1 Tax=Amphiplicatus metriothermophilus TaxID=1519374 RepID=A0A239PRW5_9PROT|nr:hypothetical protein [Amphiplicatus metriothermophilus]MBB5518388.1 hypothetical protein [Amphiplicatus metriothermophilus]SNT72447.1 hypothetical protein SAMN06297382_1491 [Amphiplicatus metriothermophilus]
MTKISDELLAAYADGEAGMADRAAVERALSQDARLRRDLERYRRLRQEIDRSFAPVLSAPTPTRLRKAIEAAAERAAAPAASLRRRLKRDCFIPAALAASFAAGLFLGVALMRAPGDDSRLLAASPALAAALDSLHDAEAIGAVRILASYRNSELRVCRRFSVSDGRLPVEGLACFAEDGAWRLAALEASAPADAYLPAGETGGLDRLTALMRPLPQDELEAFLAARRDRP